MRSLLIVITSTAASLVLLSVADAQDLGERIARAACEKACDISYNKCMEASGKVVDRENEGEIESEMKDVVKEETCQYSKEQCLEACG
ncbi:MAG: hypothetical protein A2176_10785 [Spirochaetes bacterium RBG_13_51_14]|nr:MAG: hypothetical protein A2176_10785 [Spirochaetes bacterium RBG_13_51_14]